MRREMEREERERGREGERERGEKHSIIEKERKEKKRKEKKRESSAVPSEQDFHMPSEPLSRAKAVQLCFKNATQDAEPFGRGVIREKEMIVGRK